MSAARFIGFGNESLFAQFSNGSFGAVFPFTPGATFQWADEARKLGWGYVLAFPILFAQSASSNRKFFVESDISALGMNANRFQTKPNDSDSGATLPVRHNAGAGTQPIGHIILRKGELARQLNMSPRSIQNLMSRKMIPYYRLSSRFVRFDLLKVRNALDKFEVEEIGRNPRR